MRAISNIVSDLRDAQRRSEETRLASAELNRQLAALKVAGGAVTEQLSIEFRRVREFRSELESAINAGAPMNDSEGYAGEGFGSASSARAYTAGEASATTAATPGEAGRAVTVPEGTTFVLLELRP